MNAELRSVPRAPGRLPLLGHVWPLARDTLGFVKSLRDTGDLVRVDVGTMSVYFVNSPALVNELLVTKGRSFEKGRFFDRLKILVGDGLVTAGGETHRRHRKLMQPMFHRSRIAGYAEIMNAQALALAESWRPGETVAVEREMAALVVNTLSGTMFSTDIGKPAVDAIRVHLPVIVNTLLLRTASPSFLDRVPIPANRRFDAAAGQLLRVIDDVVAAARTAGDTDRPDLLSTLLAARDADTGESLTDVEVRDELSTILFAGAENTATTLTWAFHEIARHPEVEERLLDEIAAVSGGGPVTVDAVAKYEYLPRVINEVVRLHGVTLLMRRSVEPVELGGVLLPAGTEIAFSLYALHRDPRSFPDPERFDPDRWLPERSADRPRGAFVPFGSGTRKCIGDSFAWMQMIVSLATLLSHRRLRPTGHFAREVAAAVPHPDRLPMVVEARHATEAP
ncbi:cytochrome P450 [Streptomyces sp. NPDC088354]|uniref:cytochrome P450 n=1 Tax=unclassified Streptomyces TaxID=2593676 RepID=UPI0029B5AC54|nr:cytochrome P450 [Streptomyces sp. MI02-7b]MDX3073625.1 cytochrome P450 [Streptomyces sp. MI02-7b]